MNQERMTIREQAERMAANRLQLLINRHPERDGLKKLPDGEAYSKLERYYGREFVYNATNIPIVEKWIRGRVKRFVIGISAVVVGLVAWTATLLSLWAIPALQSKSGDIQTWSAVIATIIVVVVFAWYIWKNIKAFNEGRLRDTMMKGK